MSGSGRVVYWIAGSVPCWRVLATLKEKKLDFTSKLMVTDRAAPNFMKNEEVMSINPRGQMPSFKDGDVVVNDSLAVMEYLEYAYPEIPLLPAAASERAHALQRFHESADLLKAIVPVMRMKMLDKVKTEADQDAFNQGVEKIRDEMKFWESYLIEDPTFISGEALTLADFNVVLACLFAMRGGATLAEFPHLLKYVNSLKDRESIQSTWPQFWKESPNRDWLSRL